MKLSKTGQCLRQEKPWFPVINSAILLTVCLALQGCNSTASDRPFYLKSGSLTSAKNGSQAVSPDTRVEEETRAHPVVRTRLAQTNIGDTSMRGSVLSALGHSADVKSAESKASEADINISIAKAGYMPTLQSSAGAGTGRTYDYQISLTQPVYDFGQTSSRVSQANAGKSVSSEELRAAREDVALKAAKAFISVKRYAALVAAAREDVAVHERFVQLASTRSQGGISDATEVQLANVHLGEAQSSLEDAEGYLRSAKSMYHSYVGYPAGDLTDVPELKLDFRASSTLEASADEAPTVRMAQARGDEARSAADAEKASLYPRLSVEAAYRSDTDNTNDKSSIGLRLTGPTLNGFANFQRVEAMQIAAESSRWDAEAALRNVALQVKEFSDRTPTLRNQITILDMQQEKAKKLRGLYEDQFKMGDRPFLDLINVQSDVIRLARSQINARYDILDLQYSTASALGILQQQLALSQ